MTATTSIDREVRSTPPATRPRETVERSTAATDTTRPSRWRSVVAVLLAVVAALASVLAVVGTWAERTLLDTDAWVEAVEPLPSDPAVASELSEIAADELFDHVDVEQLIADELPSDLRAVAGPIAGGLRTAVEDVAEEVLLSDEFRVVWREVNRIAHEEMLVVLRGDGDGDGDEVTSQDGTVTINLIPIVNAVLHDLTSEANNLFGTDIQLPEVTESDAETLRATLSSELGVDLPPDFAHIVVYQDDRLAEVQDGLRILADTTIALWIVAAVAAIAAFAVSQNRRRTTIHLASGIAVIAGLLAIAAEPIEHDLLSSIDDDGQRNAVQATIDIALRGIGEGLVVLAIAAIGVAVLAWLTGSGATATRLRTSTAEFVRSHRTGVAVGGLALAVLAVLVINPLTAGWFVTILIALVIFEMAVFGVTAGSDDDSRSDDDSPSDGDDAAATTEPAATPSAS